MDVRQEVKPFANRGGKKGIREGVTSALWFRISRFVHLYYLQCVRCSTAERRGVPE